MISLTPADLDFSEAYIDGDRTARWRSAAGHSPRYEQEVQPDGSRERHTVS